MRFEWDENKRLVNIRRHVLDFQDVVTIFDGDIVTVEDDRFTYDEQRFISFGVLRGEVIAIVHIERGDVTRIISARKATRYEEIEYYRQIID